MAVFHSASAREELDLAEHEIDHAEHLHEAVEGRLTPTPVAGPESVPGGREGMWRSSGGQLRLLLVRRHDRGYSGGPGTLR